MTWPSKRFHYTVESSLGAMGNQIPPWSDLIEPSVQLTGKPYFPTACCKVQPLKTDHCPLILGLHDIKRGKRRFHFEAFWPKLDDFQEAVAAAGGSVPSGPCPLLSLSTKLKATTRGLQSWSDKKVGHVASQLELAKELLH
jgi:hypothetical protein